MQVGHIFIIRGECDGTGGFFSPRQAAVKHPEGSQNGLDSVSEGLGEDAKVEMNGLIQSKSKEFSRKSRYCSSGAHSLLFFTPRLLQGCDVFWEIDRVSRLG